MSLFKNFDFFQKLSYDNVAKPSIIGSILSVIAIIIMVFLLVREIIDYFTPLIEKDSIIFDEAGMTNSKVNLNINVRISNSPCAILSVDLEDEIDNHISNISDTIMKQRINKYGGKIIDKFDFNFNSLIAAIEEGEGCLISGFIPLNKVPGNVHISYHAYSQIYQSIRYNNPQTFSKLKLNHEFFQMNFGDRQVEHIILDKFGISEHTSFNRVNELPNFKESQSVESYEYFTKLIPHLFIDEFWGYRYLNYQYSLNFQNRKRDESEMPIIKINYDLSPVTMQISLKSKSLAHTITHICAIIGGVFVIFNLLNRILVSTFDTFDDKNK